MTDMTETVAKLREAAAADLRLLAFLHSREIGSNELAVLREARFSTNLGMMLPGEEAVQALRLMDGMFHDDDSLELSSLDKSQLGGEDDTALIDSLAADYAAIYLNHQYDASPLESVWLDDDHLMYQKPMFSVRRWYENFGMGTPDWRTRSDDHIALQLEFSAHLLEQKCAGTEPLLEAAQFLDEHMLLWVGEFAEGIAKRCSTPFYAGLAILTTAYLEELRNQVTALASYPRPAPKPKVESLAEALEKTCGDEPDDLSAFMPGLEPSW